MLFFPIPNSNGTGSNLQPTLDYDDKVIFNIAKEAKTEVLILQAKSEWSDQSRGTHAMTQLRVMP